MDDPDEMFQLADLLEGVSVDCAELSIDTLSAGINNAILTHRILFKQYFIRPHPTNENLFQTLFFSLYRKQYVFPRQ